MSRDDSVSPDRMRWRSVWLFGAASFLAVLIGALVMHQGAIPLATWIRNPVASLVAAALAIFLARRGWLSAWIAPLALIVVALSFIGPGQEGVHRWLYLGPVQLNAAALVLPAAIAAFTRERAAIALPCFALIAALLAWQPDISQLAGFALAAVILGAHRFGPRGAIGALAISAATIAACLFRPDPLEAVPHVEGIFVMAWEQSPALAIAMAATLAATALGPLMVWPATRQRWTSLALTGYFSTTALACLFGAYPAPLAGYGVSFVVGWWLGFAALSVPTRKRS